MPRRPKPLEWLLTDLGAFPDCDRCTEHMLSPLLTEAIASCSLDSGTDVDDLTRRYVEHYHASSHREAL